MAKFRTMVRSKNEWSNAVYLFNLREVWFGNLALMLFILGLITSDFKSPPCLSANSKRNVKSKVPADRSIWVFWRTFCSLAYSWFSQFPFPTPLPPSLPLTQVFIVFSSKKVGPEIPWDFKKCLHADAQPRRQDKIKFSWEKLKLASPCRQMNGNQLIPVLSESLNALVLVYTNVVSHHKKRKTLMHFIVFLIAGEKISILTQVHDFPRIPLSKKRYTKKKKIHQSQFLLPR